MLVLGYLNRVYVSDGNMFLLFITAQLGSTTRTVLPSYPQHHPVSWRYAISPVDTKSIIIVYKLISPLIHV